MRALTAAIILQKEYQSKQAAVDGRTAARLPLAQEQVYDLAQLPILPLTGWDAGPSEIRCYWASSSAGCDGVDHVKAGGPMAGDLSRSGIRLFLTKGWF